MEIKQKRGPKGDKIEKALKAVTTKTQDVEILAHEAKCVIG